MTKTECPNRQILRQYLLGECPDSISHEVERHLGDCPTCEDSISQFDTATDTMMRHLPLAATRSASPQVAGWIDVLRQKPPSQGAANPAGGDRSADVDLGDTQNGNLLADGFANYEVLGILGRGGMGIVFLARHKQLNRRVALKVVRPDALASDLARRRFQREIQILGGLNHPGIVMATDAGVVGTGAYLVMEWIDGIDLGRLVRDGGPLAIDSACETARQIAEALAAAHSNAVVHRDVKPSNAMVDATGRVRLLDFGLAHVTRVIQESGDTSVGQLLGTLDYMAPEQADGEAQVDAKSDLYALGAMLFFLLTGGPPHGSRAGRSILEHIKAISHEEAPRVCTLRAGIPQELDQLIAQLLSRNPADRPQSATKVAMQLSGWSGCNLAARVAEWKQETCGAAAESSDSLAARRSLADLLGERISQSDVSRSSAAARNTVIAAEGNSRGWRWTDLVPYVAIALAAVVIMLKTPEGTLKIESEVAGVTVELVDEKDRVRELMITSGSSETQLTAGEYRVRLAGSHDGLKLDHDVVTLLNGKDVVAHITRVPTVDSVAASATAASNSERLYQGRTESEWQRQFQLETEPAAKLDAGRALLSLATALPAQEQFERILDVGEEIVRSGWTEPNYLGFALASSNYPPTAVWPGTITISPSFQKFTNELNDQIRRLPYQVIEEPLLGAIVTAREARAAFAASFLFNRTIGPRSHPIKSHPAAVQTILTKLDVPITGLDRSAMCQLLRLSYCRNAGDEQRLGLRDRLLRLSTMTHRASPDRIQRLIAGRLLGNATNLFTADWPAELADALARLVLDLMVTPDPDRVGPGNYGFEGGFVFSAAGSMDAGMQGGMGGMAGYGSGMGMGGMGYYNEGFPQFYDQHTILKLRESNRHFLSAWLKVVNEYLEAHPETSTSAKYFEVIRSIEVATRIYSDSDDWPVETTVKLLTDLLHRDYDDPHADRILHPALQTLNPAPAMVLSSIVRMTGRVPDFIVNGHPASQYIEKKLTWLKHSLKSLENPSEVTFGEGQGLLLSAPYETLKLVCQSDVLHSEEFYKVRETPISDLFFQLVPRAVPAIQEGDLRMDPVLLLAILTQLSGASLDQDAEIARFFTEAPLVKSFNSQLTNVLESSLKVRTTTRQLLDKIAANAKSDKLIEAIRKASDPK